MRRRWNGWDPRIRWALGAVVLLIVAGAVVAVSDADRDADSFQATSRDDTSVLDSRTAEATSGAPTGDFSQKSAPGVAASQAGVTADEATGAGQIAPVPPGGGAGGTGDQVVRTGDLRLELKKGDFRAAFDRSNALAVELGGFVADSATERVGDRLAAGSLTLRIPGKRFDEARRRLAGLGKVESENVHGQDVSGELVDLEARLRSLRAQEDVLRALLGRAKTVGEVIQVEQQLGGIRQQIEQLAAQDARLKDQVAMATLSVSMFEKGAPTAVPGDDKPVLVRSLERALAGALAVVGGTLVVIGYLVPLSLLALLGWAAYRLATRRRPDPLV